MAANDQNARPGLDVLAGTTVSAPGGAVTDTALAGVPVPGSGAVLSDAALRRALHGLPGVDQTGAQARTAALATRSIKREAKLWALDMAVRMVDLTTLEGADTPGKVRGLCAKARHPDPADPAVPPVAAVCVYPDLVAVAKGELAGSQVAVASVATAFPSGRASLAVKLADVAEAVDAGADEVDMVIDRGAFLAGRYAQVYEEVRAVREACGSAHLKVILETGELATLDNVSRASWLVMLAGADFIKTSTGKLQPAATPPVALVMLSAVRDFAAPPAGGSVSRWPAGCAPLRKPSGTWCWSGRPPGRTGFPRTTSASARPACSTTCSCSAVSNSRAPTPVRTTSRSIRKALVVERCRRAPAKRSGVRGRGGTTGAG